MAQKIAVKWLLHDEKGKPVSNFAPLVIARVQRFADGVAEQCVRLELLFYDGRESKKFIESLREIESIKWTEKDIACRFHPNCTPAKASRYLADQIRSALDKAPVETVYHIKDLGIHHIEGNVIFCAGCGFILAPSAKVKSTLELGEFAQALAVDKARYSEHAAFDGMMSAIRLSPDSGRTIFAHTLSGIMRTVYAEAGIEPRTVLQVVAKTSHLKTTFVTFLSQIYNRDAGIRPQARLNSTLPFIEEILHEYRDAVVVVDDAHPADNAPKIVRDNEATLEEITRRVGDGIGRGRKKGNAQVMLKPRCNVIVPAEYPYGQGSTAARTLVVELSEQISDTKLHECQCEPLLVSTFYSYYICWYVANYYEIRDILKAWLNEFRGAGIPDVLRRLNEAYLCLHTTFALFLQYAFEKGFITSEEAEDTLGSFQHLLIKLIYNQNERAEQHESDRPREVSYLDRIRSMYAHGRFKLADSADLYAHGAHDGFIHRECLCLNPTRLTELIHKSVPTADKTSIGNELLAKGALVPAKDGNKANQVNAAGNKRFFHIPLKKLI